MERVIDLTLNADANDYVQGMQEAATAAGSFNETVQTQTGLAGGVSKALAMMTPGKAMVSGFSAATVAAAAYNKQMTSMRQTTEVLSKSNQKLDYNKMSKDVKAMGRDYGTSAVEAKKLLETFHGIGVRGPKAEEQMNQLARTTVKLGKATGESAEYMAESFGQLSKQFGNLQPKRFEAMGDTLTYVSKALGTSAASVTQFSRSIAPFAKQLGMSQSSVMGLSAAFTTLGEDSFVAQNTVSKMLSDIGRAVRDNTPELKLYAEMTGLTVDRFKELEATHPEEIVQRLVKNLASGNQGIRGLERIGIEGVRSQRALAQVVESGSLEEAMAAVNAPERKGAMDRSAAVAMKDMFSEMARAAEASKQAGASLGQGFVPVATMGAGMVADVTSGISSVLQTAPVQKAIQVAALGAGTIGIAKMATAMVAPLAVANSGFVRGIFGGRAAERTERGAGAGKWGTEQARKYDEAVEKEKAGTGPGPSRSGQIGYSMGRRLSAAREESMDAIRIRAGLPTLAEERQAAAAAGGAGGAPGGAAKRGGIFRTAARIGAMSAAAYINQTVTEPARNLSTPTGNQFENRPNYGDRTGSAEQRTWGTRMRQAMGQQYNEQNQYWESAGDIRRKQRQAVEDAGGTWQRRSFKEAASESAARAAASARVVKEYHEVAKASGTTAPVLKTLGVAAKNASAGLLAAGGTMAGKGLGAAGSGLATAGKGLMGFLGGPMGLAMLGGTAAYGIYSKTKSTREEREESFSDTTKALSDYTNVLGEATPGMSSFAGATTAATNKLLDMSKQATSYSEALDLVGNRDFRTLAGQQEPIHEFISSDAKGIAAEINAMSPGMSANALALSLGDVTAQFGADIATEVANIVKTNANFGGTQEAGPGAVATLSRGVTDVSAERRILLRDTSKAQETGAQIGAYYANEAAVSAETKGSAYEAQTDALVGAGQALKTAAESWGGINRGSTLPNYTEREQFGQLVENTIKPVIGANSELIGDAVNDAIKANNPDVIKAIEEGASVEDIVRITSKTSEDATKEQQAQMQAFLDSRTAGAKAAAEAPWWQTYKDTAASMGLGFTGGRNVVGVMHEGSEVQQANIEAGGTDVTKRLAAVNDLFKQMGDSGGSLDNMIGQLTVMTQIMPPESIDTKTMQTALQFGSNMQQYSLIGGSRGQKWGAAAAPIMQMMNYKPTNDKELEMVLGAQQQGIQLYQEMVSSYAQQAQATHEYQKQRSRMEKDYARQRSYAVQDFARQQQYAHEDYNKTRSRAERDYGTARSRAERDYNTSRARAYRDYAKQEFRARRDFAIQMERAERDYQISKGRAERDYQINRERAQRDFNISQERATRDYNIGRERAERDYHRSRFRAERDYEKQRARAQRDFDKQQKRTIEEFAKSALDPFKRYGPRASMTSGGLVTNLGSQNRQMKKQIEGINKLKEAGLSEDAIRTLNLASPEMYSQVQQLLQGIQNNPGRISELNSQVLERMDLAGQMAPMQTTWQQQLEDFNQQMSDMGEDFATSMRDMEEDFKTSMDDMAADFAKSMADAVADFTKSMNDAADDFTRQMRDMEEDFNRSMRDAHDDFDRQMADMYADFSQQMADMAEDFTKQMGDMAADHAKQMGDMEADFNSQMARAEAAQATALARMAAAHATAMAQAQTDFNDMVAALDGKWERLGEEMVLDSEETGRQLKAALKGSFDETLAYFNGKFQLKPQFEFNPTTTWNVDTSGMDYGDDSSPAPGMPAGGAPGHLTGMPFTTSDSEDYGPDGKGGNAKNTQALIDFVKKTWGITASGWAASGHSPNSFHYRGKAVDIGGAVRNDKALGSQIASFFSQPGVAKAFGVSAIIWHDQKNTSRGKGWQPYQGNGIGDSRHVNHVHVSLWDQGGIAKRPTLGMIAEAGSPEMMIPLNARGADFFIKLMGRYMDAHLDRGTPASASGQPLIVNNGVNYDYSTRFTGDVTVQANDPDKMFAELKAKARHEALTRPRR